MASTGKCAYCGAALRSDQKICPNCGAENPLFVKDSPRTVFQPKTIEELQEYCAERGMPLLRMRFFIGEDYRKPRAFGIYRKGNNVVVYKNKSDGTRAIRYEGPDEARGVNELFHKLLSECHNRGIYPDGKPVTRSDVQEASPSAGKHSDDAENEGPGAVIGCFFGCFFGFMYLIFGLLMFPRFFVRSLAFLLPLLLGVLLNRVIQSNYYDRQFWPEGPKKAEKDRLFGDPITLWEYLAYIGNVLRYGKPKKRSQLTVREREAARKVGWIPGFLRVLVCTLLVVGIGLSIRGFFHRNDGFFVRPDGNVVYHYGSNYYETGGYDSSYVFSDNEDSDYYYLGTDWDLDWGLPYEPPTLSSSFENTVDSFGEYMDSHRSGGPDSSGDSDRGGADYDPWDSNDTDWESDW